MKNPPSQVKVPAENSPIRVLVVHSRKAQIIADVLELEADGCPTCLATPVASAEEALLRAKAADDFDVIAIEMALPIAGATADRGGLALLGEVKRLRPDAEIVMITHFDEATFGLEAMRAGAFGCFESSTQVWRLLRIMVGQAAERKGNREKLEQHECNSHLLANLDTLLHNMNGPLAIISGFTEIATNKVAAAGDLREIAAAAERLRRMVRDLRAASRGEEPVVVRESVDFARFWADCMPGLRAICDQAAVRFDAGMPRQGTVQMDAEKMRQALEQLVLNAVRAVGQRSRRGQTGQGAIAVRCRPAGSGSLSIAVADDGIGMSAELAARVFGDLRSGDIHGAGLGLKSVKAIVAQHQGWIAVSSRVGEGTVFTITLPVVDGHEPDKAVQLA